jgi:hypothetical protein
MGCSRGRKEVRKLDIAAHFSDPRTITRSARLQGGYPKRPIYARSMLQRVHENSMRSPETTHQP